MKQLFCISLLLAALSANAASPSYDNFNPAHFTISGKTVGLNPTNTTGGGAGGGGAAFSNFVLTGASIINTYTNSTPHYVFVSAQLYQSAAGVPVASARFLTDSNGVDNLSLTRQYAWETMDGDTKYDSSGFVSPYCRFRWTNVTGNSAIFAAQAMLTYFSTNGGSGSGSGTFDYTQLSNRPTPLLLLGTNNASSLTNVQAANIVGTLTNNTTGNAATANGSTNLYLSTAAGGIYAGSSNVTQVISNYTGLSLSSTSVIYFVDAPALSYFPTFYNSTNFGWYWSDAKLAYTNQHADMAGCGLFLRLSDGAGFITNATRWDVNSFSYVCVFGTNSLASLTTDPEEFQWIDDDDNSMVNSANGNGMDARYASTNGFNFSLAVHGAFDGSFAGSLATASNLPAANISAGVNRGIQAGGSITNWSSWIATNSPTRGFTWNASKVPLLAWDEWNTFEANRVPYSTNRLRWATNAILATETNYLAYGWDTIFITDGWQASSRSGGGLTWDTAIYPSPTTLPWLASFAHAHGMKIMLYTSIGTTTCATKPGSGVDNIYRDIQDMMTWGFDGTMVDVCDGVGYTNKNTRRAFYRLLNQAVEDYNELLIATNGIPRPFYVQATFGYANNTPDVFDMDELYGASAWSVSYGINYAQYGTNTLETAKKILKQLGPYIGPGRFGWAESVYQNSLNASILTNLANIFCMSLQPWRGSFGNGTSPVFTNGSSGYTGYITNAAARFIYTNTEFLNLYRDASCIPARVVNTNSLTELWVRPIGGGNIASVQPTNLVFWFNKATTNFTAWVNVTNFNGASNVSYTIRDPWLKTTVGTFTNQFTATVNANYGLLYYVYPTVFSGTFSVITNGANTATLTFENGILKSVTP